MRRNGRNGWPRMWLLQLQSHCRGRIRVERHAVGMLRGCGGGGGVVWREHIERRRGWVRAGICDGGGADRAGWRLRRKMTLTQKRPVLAQGEAVAGVECPLAGQAPKTRHVEHQLPHPHHKLIGPDRVTASVTTALFRPSSASVKHTHTHTHTQDGINTRSFEIKSSSVCRISSF